MGRPANLTKQMLLDLGITNITENGEVYYKDELLTPHIVTKYTRFGSKSYRVLVIYDKEIYQQRRLLDPKCTTGTKTIVLSRAIWAWHHDYCPGNLDIDHINDNSLDDRLDNYQLLTRKENLAKRKGYMNQYKASYREKNND